MEQNSRIYVAGHNGLVGSAIVRALKAQGYRNIVTATRKECDLRYRGHVEALMKIWSPEYVFLAAAKVGGIMANSTHPVEFLEDNLAIQSNVIRAAYHCGVSKLAFLGSSCIYPRLAPQPIHESALLTGALEPTNEAYAVAKIAGIKLCQSYRKQCGFGTICLMPTNLYGPGDNFDLETSHVLPAMIRKFHDAKLSGSHSVTLWGTGKPRRELMHVDDCADAAVHLMRCYDDAEIINVGTGEDDTISGIALAVAVVVGYKGEILWDDRKPDGTPIKVLNVDRLHATGWRHKIELLDGIRSTYEWFRFDRRNSSSTMSRSQANQ